MTQRDSDEGLRKDFLRLVAREGRAELEVGVVTWPGPAGPTVEWKTLRRWTRPPTAEALRAAEDKALANRRYFRQCSACGQLQNVGHMHDEVLCQGCAHERLGVVY